MRNIIKVLGLSLAGFGSVLTFGDVSAVTSRSGVAGANVQRMPTMPTFPSGATGNLSGVDTVEPTTTSTYTVDNCMKDILNCVQGGALPNGLNDMFNSDLRASIVNGMGLCAVQVEKCIDDVTDKNGRKLYFASGDVWGDFNSREVQPAYFSFVLRKTGLTPNQAENTCLLLDRNVYGSSFSAVGTSNEVTTEFQNSVNAYNDLNGSSNLPRAAATTTDNTGSGSADAKNNPQGMGVNSDSSIDGNRGYYARWDATTGECLVRVAAYNKNEQITNEVLWGLLGNNNLAEVWKSAGSSFTCDKDLFGFALKRNTADVATVGFTGGTLLGAGIGAAVKKETGFDCGSSKNLGELNTKLRTLSATEKNTLPLYLPGEMNLDTGISRSECNQLVAMYDKYYTIEALAKTNNPAYDANDTFKTFINQESFNIVVCTGKMDDCVNHDEIAEEMKVLKPLMEKMGEVLSTKENTKKVSGANVAIGATIGAGAAGLATAITAFVESNNISCRVGDGLDKIDLNKSYTIDTLKDFYVKWNLNLPETVFLESGITSCDAWENACSAIVTELDCNNAQVYYKPRNVKTGRVIDGACEFNKSGSGGTGTMASGVCEAVSSELGVNSAGEPLNGSYTMNPINPNGLQYN